MLASLLHVFRCCGPVVTLCIFLRHRRRSQIGVGADFGIGWIPPGIEAAEALLVTMFVGYLDHGPWLERYLDWMCVLAEETPRPCLSTLNFVLTTAD